VIGALTTKARVAYRVSKNLSVSDQQAVHCVQAGDLGWSLHTDRQSIQWRRGQMQLVIKDVDRHQGQPEQGQRRPQSGEHPDRLIHPGAKVNRRQDSQRHSNQQGQDKSRER